MWRVTIKGLLAHKLRLALTALAIVLGVTFIAGTFVLTDTLHNTFNTLFGNIYQSVDFQVRGVAQFGSGGTATRNPVAESVVSTVRGVPGVEAAEGSVTGYAQYIAPNGKAITTGGAPTLGFAFDPNPALSPLRLTQGSPPTRPNQVVMDLGTAQKYHFKVGEQVRILLARPDEELHHQRAGAVWDGQQPGRGDARRVRHADGAGAVGRCRQVRQHQRHRPTGREQDEGAARHRARPASG